MNQKILCPICQTEIVFDVYSLLQNAKFTCPNPACNAQISLSNESKAQVAEAMIRFEKLKSELHINRNKEK